MKIIITDMQTLEKKIIRLPDAVARRVMRRAISLYNSAKRFGIEGVTFGYYLKYSWQLEKGHVWL